MICEYCNCAIDDNATKCRYCGEKVLRLPEENRDGSYRYCYPDSDESGGILTNGIISIILAAFWFLGPLCIILGVQTIKKASVYLKNNRPHRARAKAGHITGTIGVGFGILETLMTVMLILFYMAPQ